MNRKYTVQSVSRITGLTPDTLRAWERRYSAVVPDREGGRRVYSEDDLERLQLLARSVGLGHPIRNVSQMSDEELRALISDNERLREAENPAANLLTRMREAVENFDGLKLREELGLAAAALPPKRLAMNVLAPLLREVGDGWHEGRFSVAQERIVSLTMRNLLGAMIQQYEHRADGPSLMFAAPSGERHEMGILLAAFLAVSHGARCHYLGPDVPVEDIARAAEATASSAVVLGLIYPEDNERVVEQTRILAERMRDTAELWVGGPVSQHLNGLNEMSHVTLIEDLDEFQRRVEFLRNARRGSARQ